MTHISLANPSLYANDVDNPTDGTNVLLPDLQTIVSQVNLHDDEIGTLQTSVSTITVSGAIMQYAGATAPTGWLLANGAAVSRTTYATLFGVISTTYGSGDGSTTFNLPNLLGTFVAGAGNGPVGNLSLAATGGNSNITLSTSQLPVHTHTATVVDSGHSHNMGTFGGVVNAGTTEYVGDSGGGSAGSPIPTASAATGITVTNSNVGSGAAINIVPSYLALNYIIKT
jgi:microcystin-dependent protein